MMRASASDELSLNQKFFGANRDYAVSLVHRVCCLAGNLKFLDRHRSAANKNLAAAIERHDTAPLFDWLVEAFSYQGIADRIAHDYMKRHGKARWASIKASLSRNPSCPKLNSYWHFDNCGYRKGAATCSEPQQLPSCPLPALPLRNGNLNQMAYSLFLFIRDVAGGDLVAWIDTRLEAADSPSALDRLEAMRAALLEPLRCIYGVSDKVLNMALAELLLGAGQHRPHWAEVGARMIAVDRLVHNFLHRAGILRRLEAEHAYGPACYRSEGCTGVIGLIAREIDAREFNPRFPKIFPRFVQHAIWRYCAGFGLDICNGNNIDDRKPCANSICRLYSSCDRLTLREKAINISVNT
jgi:hypothetical protein